MSDKKIDKRKRGQKITLRQAEMVKKHISASQITKRLKKHALADEDIMTQSQVSAAKFLLSLVVPQLKAVELSGETTVNHKLLSKEEIIARLKSYKEAKKEVDNDAG